MTRLQLSLSGELQRRRFVAVRTDAPAVAEDAAVEDRARKTVRLTPAIGRVVRVLEAGPQRDRLVVPEHPVAGSRVPPVHVAPAFAGRVQLVEDVVLAVLVAGAVGIVHPVARGSEVAARPPRVLLRQCHASSQLAVGLRQCRVTQRVVAGLLRHGWAVSLLLVPVSAQ